MKNENVGGIFFTEKEQDFGKLFNEFNSYILSLDADLAQKEQTIFELSDLPEVDSAIQALNSYSSKDLNELKVHFRALNEAFDSVENRVQTSLNRVLT